MRALIIEDDPTAQLVLKSILCNFADVTECTNGIEGLQAFYTALKGNTGFDLVCLDIGLPDVQGNDLLRLFRQAEVEKSTKQSVVLVMSACKEDRVIQEMLTLGANAYVLKPVNRVNLIVQLRGLGLTVRAKGAS
jgi:two-component system chemotaxis response regulator CheY